MMKVRLAFRYSFFFQFCTSSTQVASVYTPLKRVPTTIEFQAWDRPWPGIVQPDKWTRYSYVSKAESR